jgi:hypothetical protein
VTAAPVAAVPEPCGVVCKGRAATQPPIGVLFKESGVYSPYSDDVRFGRYDGRYDSPMIGCYQGYMQHCDALFYDADDLRFDDPPRQYGNSCGGRVNWKERAKLHDAGVRGCLAIFS